MNKFLMIMILLIFFFTISALTLARFDLSLNNQNVGGTPSPGLEINQNEQLIIQQSTASAKATATFGAEQFHLQLTAIAGEK